MESGWIGPWMDEKEDVGCSRQMDEEQVMVVDDSRGEGNVGPNLPFSFFLSSSRAGEA